MKNEDMPANALSGDAYQDFAGYNEMKNDSSYNPNCQGETKREKAFWQVYSAMLVGYTDLSPAACDELARLSMNAVNAGFKALDEQD